MSYICNIHIFAIVTNFLFLDNTHNLTYIRNVSNTETLMRKEVIIAVIAGLTIGLVLAFGLVRVNTRNRSITPIAENDKTDDASIQQIAKDVKMTLTNIDDGEIYSESPVTLQGIVGLPGRIVISGETEDYILETDANGSFQKEVKLVKGVNKIIIESFDVNGKITDTKEFSVIYYPDFEKDIS
jgi:hypothetical protein